MEKTESNIAAFIREAEVIVSKAGETVKRSFFENKSVSEKINFADLVTETDKNVEHLIKSYLNERFPDHCFIGEESTNDEPLTLSEKPTWILDPIDGTTNFIHRFPFCCISLGLLVNKVTEFGIVYNPITNELFSAQRGKGSFLNGHRLTVSSVSKLNKALVCAEFGASRDDETVQKKLSSMKKVIQNAHGIRSLGSAAMNMCYVAAGRCDAYWEYGTHAWDAAAGHIIVLEAGGTVCCTDGSAMDILNRKILCAGTRELAMEISHHLDDIELPRD